MKTHIPIGETTPEITIINLFTWAFTYLGGQHVAVSNRTQHVLNAKAKLEYKGKD